MRHDETLDIIIDAVGTLDRARMEVSPDPTQRAG